MAFCGKYKLSEILFHRFKSLKMRQCLPGNLPVDVLYGVYRNPSKGNELIIKYGWKFNFPCSPGCSELLAKSDQF